MKIKYLILILTLVLVNISTLAAASPYYYNITLDYDNGNININSISIIYSREVLSQLNGDYFILLNNNNNNELAKYNFSIESSRILEEFDKDGIVINGTVEVIKNITFNLFIPYEESADTLVILNKGQELSRKQISKYSKNLLSEKQINELRTQSNGKSSIDMTSPKKSNPFLYYILALILIITLVFSIYWFYYKK